MAIRDEGFASLVASVAENYDEIDQYIRNSDPLVDGKHTVQRDSVSDPLEYLKEWRWTGQWDRSCSRIMDQWDKDQMSAMRFNSIIERLSGPAARLDVLIPRLEGHCQRLPNVPSRVLRNAREMHTCVNSFLNSADDGLNYWKRQENILVESEIRQRRPTVWLSVDPKSAIEDDAPGDISETGTMVPKVAAWRSLYQDDSALLALTAIISIIACIIQSCASFVDFQVQAGNTTGSTSDPDFYNAIQTFLMQVLTLYTALTPELRSTKPQYKFWTRIISAASLGTGIASLVVYPFFKVLSPLLACLSNVMGAFVTLQLVLFLGGPINRVSGMAGARKGV